MEHTSTTLKGSGCLRSALSSLQAPWQKKIFQREKKKKKQNLSYSIFNNLSLITARERVSQDNSTIVLLEKNRQGVGVGKEASTDSHLQDLPCSSLKQHTEMKRKNKTGNCFVQILEFSAKIDHFLLSIKYTHLLEKKQKKKEATETQQRKTLQPFMFHINTH